MFVVKDPLSTNFQTNVFKAGRTNSSWINVLPKCVLLLDKCVLFGLMHLVTQLRLVFVEGYSCKNWRRESCVIYSILFCSLLLCSILLCLSVSLLFMFKEEDHEDDEKKDESYFLFFSPKRWFVILAFHVPYEPLLLFPSRFLIRTCFYPLRCSVSPFLPLRFAEDMNVMDVPLLPQCIIIFNVPVCQRRITLQKVVITLNPTPPRNVNSLSNSYFERNIYNFYFVVLNLINSIKPALRLISQNVVFKYPCMLQRSWLLLKIDWP